MIDLNVLNKYGKLLGAVVILPLIIMAIYVVVIANDEIAIEDVLAVKISDERYIHKYTGREDIEEYVSLILDAEDGAVQEIDSSYSSRKIEFEMRDGVVRTYYLYPVLDGKSLLVDGMGLVRYAGDVSRILSRVEYESFYSERWLPKINISSLSVENKNVSPDKYVWNYKKSDSQFYEYTSAETSKNDVVLDISASSLKKGIVSFSVQPETMVLSYKVNGKTYNSAEIMPVSNGDEFEVAVYAKWPQMEGCNFYGEGEWVFRCVYKDSPEFALNDNKISAGEVLVLEVENVAEGEKLTIDTDIITNCSPVVYKGVNKSFALIPVGIDTPSGKYDIKVSSGEAERVFNVDVSAENGEFYRKNIGAEAYVSATNPEGIKEFEDFISSIVAKSSHEFLWKSENIKSPVNAQIKIPFGSEVLYNEEPPQVTYEGIAYGVSEKTSVLSAAEGKVVFSDETAKTGKAVVIDHGCGIMTHYYHLSVISAFEGETVESGKLIGLSGSTGFTDGACLQFAVSVNGVFVNPDMFME